MDIYKKLSNEEIIKKQKEQHSQSRKKNLTPQRSDVRAQDIALLKRIFPDAKSVLCVGSREDSEVKDFIDSGFDTVGTDILGKTTLIREIDAHDLDKHFGEDEFDIVFASHVLEHVSNARKVMENIKLIAKEGALIVLPMTPGKEPKWKHPTMFEIMKATKGKEDKNIFKQPEKYVKIWADFDSLRPFELSKGAFRDGLTEPREVWICLKF